MAVPLRGGLPVSISVRARSPGRDVAREADLHVFTRIAPGTLPGGAENDDRGRVSAEAAVPCTGLASPVRSRRPLAFSPGRRGVRGLDVGSDPTPCSQAAASPGDPGEGW